MKNYISGAKGIIFDLDGTLADTLPLCVFSFQEALENVTGSRPTVAQVEAYFGYSEEGIVENLLPDNWSSCMDEFLEIYKQHHHMCSELFVGMRELLDYLRAKSIKMAMVTGKGPHTAKITLDKLGLDGYFEFVETGSAKGSIKPECIERILDKWQVQPSEIFYVGDSIGDIKDSKKVGVKSIAAAWASTSEPELLIKNNPHLIFHKVEEFKAFIEKEF